MDMFNLKRKDNPSMDRYMDPKGKPFGGPAEKSDFDKSKKDKLSKYQRVIERDPNFEGGNFNHNYDPTWKAITRDKISRDAKKKPFNPMYAKPTIATTDAVEEGRIVRFEEFVNENFEFEAAEPMEAEETPETGYEVDEEKLADLMDKFGDDLTAMIDQICEEMEIEKDECCDLLCAAVEKSCTEEAEEESTDEEPSEEDED